MNANDLEFIRSLETDKPDPNPSFHEWILPEFSVMNGSKRYTVAVRVPVEALTSGNDVCVTREIHGPQETERMK
jgi:hypothetical protein